MTSGHTQRSGCASSFPPPVGERAVDFPDGSAGPGWRIAIDTGGTFTDAVAIAPDGSWHRAKVPSDGAIRCRARGHAGRRDIELHLPVWLPCPARFVPSLELLTPAGRRRILARASGDAWILDQPLADDLHGPVALASRLDAPLLAVHVLVGVAPGESLPAIELRLSTTRATNALLERCGARTGLIVSEGFDDLLEIGDQSRPELFALDIRKRPALAERTCGLPQRRLANGASRTPLAPDTLRTVAKEWRALGIDSVAVSFLHALADPADETLAAKLLGEAGFRTVATGSGLSDSPRFLSRTETAVVHATLAPIVEGYLADVGRAVPLASVFMMTSAGGVQRADRYLARDALLSGPAGGVAGIAEVGRRTDTRRLLGLDMGGTSADVARWDGEFAYRSETRVGDARVAAPALRIESVAAGGGSICSVRRGELRVGPESAGARPGPACYGLGGPLTLTDVNLLLGRMDPDRMAVPVSIAAASDTLEAVRSRAEREQGRSVRREDLLQGFLALADERMAAAITAVSVREGIDPREDTLVPFGGAGGQHACALADRLGIREVLFPTDAGLLSARGLLGASVERFASRALLRPLPEVARQLEGTMAELVAEASELVRHDVGEAELELGPCSIALRLVGQDRPLELPFGPAADLPNAFATAFRMVFGYHPPERALEVECMRAVVRVAQRVPAARSQSTRSAGAFAQPVGAVGPTPVWERNEIAPGTVIGGPALLVDATSTAYLAEDWLAEVLPEGDIRARRTTPGSGLRAGSMEGAADLDLFACRLEAIATGMGEQLRRTAFSTNVKERLDYSCAVLDQAGTLAANAPHLPVHLGAMGMCVRAVAAMLDLGPGDVAVTNHPAYGGSHLPDVTVITPVFMETTPSPTLLGYVASRAHHAEIGGTRPGSFPPSAGSLVEEGVVLPPLKIVEGGVARLDRVERLLRTAPHPSRAPEENLADIEAAIAANAHGAKELAALGERYGIAGLRRHFACILDRAESALRDVLRSRGPGTVRAIERLDDGAPISVSIEVLPGGEGRARIDYSGSAPVHPRNFNAPLAVVRAATLYVLRLLVGEDVPLNEGLLRPIELIVPEGMLNPPFQDDPTRCPPIVAGNTETSQRVTDALLRALGLVAGGQGTMNNLLFGNARYGMYETIAGGAGATSFADGASATHVHMTNTRITDPEVLERRCPVLVRRFAVRRGSGGRGAHRGGDGVVREIEFLEAAQVSLLSQHRIERPYGLEGGEPGAPGAQWIVRPDGSREAIEGVTAIDLEAGDAIRIETPGGGGFGLPRS